ncbi:hypothetical protein NQZ68_013283, partial [Dissostichus eleginoides]
MDPLLNGSHFAFNRIAVYPRLPSKQLVPICFFFCSCGLRLGGARCTGMRCLGLHQCWR